MRNSIESHEPFDLAELVGTAQTNHVPLVKPEADLRDDYFRRDMNPPLYAQYPLGERPPARRMLSIKTDGWPMEVTFIRTQLCLKDVLKASSRNMYKLLVSCALLSVALCDQRSHQHISLGGGNRHSAPQPRVHAPAPSHSQPAYAPPPQQPSYAPAQPTYAPPPQQPSYAPAQPSYAPKPRPSYQASYSQPAPSYKQPEYNDVPNYNFNWAVKDDYSGNDFGQEESRNGYDTNGVYYVLLPDGRRQTVTYKVNGDSGWVADVQYEGEARYDAAPSHRQPSYQPAPQTYKAPEPQYGPRSK
ncbi:unnamed protein product [Cyprideis torosa]|uniref:Uncharacterized protein n=1 Tax=Cyprideis torosa TaxID=163714 RepID=A0A7R8ZKG8_9CRUS|nr:unnamed protein product [Cyprideis torosa]CAG0880215.1 unnamed protein product [Cyprideis torosa]